MNKPISQKLDMILPILVMAAITACLVFFNFCHNTLPDPDSYYNIALSKSIKVNGLFHRFDWAQFSILRDRFSDRDLMLHILIIPFLGIISNPALAGKVAVLLFLTIFILTYLFILKKYLPGKIAAVFLIPPFLPPFFSLYALQLRSVTLSNILLILCIYFITEKRYFALFMISVIYPLTHISFFTLGPLVIVAEFLRFTMEKELCLKNIIIVISGLALGCIAHPNFPNNLLITYLNGILLPINIITGNNIGFSGEIGALGLIRSSVSNYSLFAGSLIALLIAIKTKDRLSFHSAVWLLASSYYVLIAFYHLRFWYQANMLFFIFLASYFGSITRKFSWSIIISGIWPALLLCLISAPILLNINLSQYISYDKYLHARSAQYEKAGRWMADNIPDNRIIYNSYWDDTSYFVYFNPDNRYVTIGDPIYMYCLYPKELYLMNSISMGMVSDPGIAIKKIFKAEFGYVRKEEPLYRQIRKNEKDLRIIYDDPAGAVFEVL